MVQHISNSIFTGIILVICFSLITGPIQAQTISEPVQPAALPHTYSITLTMEAGETSISFSFTVASTEFQATCWDIRGEFQGMLRMEDEETVFMFYDLRFDELVTASGPEQGQWRGSVLIREDKDVEIIKTPGYTFSLRLSRVE